MTLVTVLMKAWAPEQGGIVALRLEVHIQRSISRKLEFSGF